MKTKNTLVERTLAREGLYTQIREAVTHCDRTTEVEFMADHIVNACHEIPEEEKDYASFLLTLHAAQVR